MDAGGQLRSARQRAGLSVRRLAARAGVSPSTVWRIEAGRLDPTVGMLERLMAAVGTAPAAASPTREAAVSLALGRLTAAEVLRDPERLFGRARRRVTRSLADPDVPAGARRWSMEWARLLDGPLDGVVAGLIEDSERGYELRQNSPFTGVLSEDQRVQAIHRASREHRAARSA